MVEEDDTEVRFKRGSHEPPHVLVAPEAVREHHGAGARAADLHIVPPRCRHPLPSCANRRVAGIREPAAPSGSRRYPPATGPKSASYHIDATSYPLVHLGSEAAVVGNGTGVAQLPARHKLRYAGTISCWPI